MMVDVNGLVYVDVNVFMVQVKIGIMYNGIFFMVFFVSGGVFFLDGIYFILCGNVFLVNEFIKVINMKFSVFILQVNVVKYLGVMFL